MAEWLWHWNQDQEVADLNPCLGSNLLSCREGHVQDGGTTTPAKATGNFNT